MNLKCIDQNDIFILLLIIHDRSISIGQGSKIGRVCQEYGYTCSTAIFLSLYSFSDPFCI